MSAFVPRLAAAVLTVFALACNSKAPSGTLLSPNGSADVVGGVRIGDDNGSLTRSDPYLIVGNPWIWYDNFHVTVQYGGGCKRHIFMLFASKAFMESNPVQSSLAIHHVANDDHCDALITEELTFDLRRLRETWQRSYQTRHGTIVLRLSGYDGRIVYEF